MSLSISDANWLTSEEASKWIDEFSESKLGPNQLLKSLRKSLSPAQAGLVVEQIELRQRARRKFSNPEKMRFSRRSLEQSSGQLFADYKAYKLRDRIGAGKKVADLCCGIGGDTISFADAFNVTAIDMDPAIAVLAQFNLDGSNSKNYKASVLAQDCTAFDLHHVDAWHIDPDRRVDSSRTTGLQYMRPSGEQIDLMRKTNPNCMIKLAPASAIPEHWDCSLEFIGDRKECKQQVANFGELQSSNHFRAATLLTCDGKPTTFSIDRVSFDNCVPAEQSAIKEILIEPTSSLLCAELVDAFAAKFQLNSIAESKVYLTASKPVPNMLVSNFEIVDSAKLDAKRVVEMVRSSKLVVTEFKNRGVEVKVRNQFEKSIRDKFFVPNSDPDSQAVLFLIRNGKTSSAILAKRIRTE